MKRTVARAPASDAINNDQVEFHRGYRRRLLARALLSLFSGALLTLSFSPFQIYTLAFISPAVFLFLLLRASAKKAFWLGWLFGIGFFATGCSWIEISINHFGNASSLLAIFITALFILWMGLYPAALAYFFRKFFAKKSDIVNALLIFPSLWVIFEYLRATLFTGFPWILLGYSQLTTPLSAYAPIIGVYGLSLLVIMISGALMLIATKQVKKTRVIALCVILGIPGIGFIFQHHLWTKPFGKPIQASLIQGNIPFNAKWNTNFIIQNISIYKNLTFDNFSSKLIVWPEGAFPLYPQQSGNFIPKLSQIAQSHHSNIIFGAPILNQKTNQYYNGLLLIGDHQGEYLKRHLVPFGEYIPLPNIFGKIMRYFTIPMSNFSHGPKDQSDLIVDDVRIAPFICYEIVFPNAVLQAAKKSEMLITLSDDSWFGKSIALSQHLEMAQMRSLETNRPQLLSTNTGITAFISPLGKIEHRAPIDQQTALTDNVQPMTGNTPLMLWNYYPVIVIVMVFLLIGLMLV